MPVGDGVGVAGLGVIVGVGEGEGVWVVDIPATNVVLSMKGVGTSTGGSGVLSKDNTVAVKVGSVTISETTCRRAGLTPLKMVQLKNSSPAVTPKINFNVTLWPFGKYPKSNIIDMQSIGCMA